VKKFCGLLAFLFLLFAATGAYAFGAVHQDQYLLPKGAVHHGDLAVSAEKVVIEGTIDGDLYVFSESVQVLGEVTGDVFSFSANTTILGKVDGSIRSFTQNLTISGSVSRSVTSASQHVLITEQGEIQRNVLLFAANADLHGKVDREFNGMIGNVRITGKVGRGISLLKAHVLRLDSTAVIAGDLNYASPQRAIIANGATIEGEERYTSVVPAEQEGAPVFPLWTFAASMLSTLLIWLGVRLCFPSGLQRIYQQLDQKLPAVFGLGAAILLASLIAIAVLLVTVVGIPAAVILLCTLVVFTYTAKVFVGSWLGTLLRDRFHWRLHPLLAELLGVVFLQCIVLIPFVGWLLSLPVWLVFFGAAAAAVRQTNKTFLP
jgi:cytoskeletal protein CcmA (bactofilin family)